jgi:hypothetical protein
MAALGWPVFPCGSDKRPIGSLVEHGHKDATTNPRRIKALWKVAPEALIGVALPVGTLGVDIDDMKAFLASGLSLPEALIRQATPRGGEHDVYRIEGDAPQTVKRHPGVDTRVGGLGYLVAWHPEAWGVAPGDLTLAPEWVREVASGGEASLEVRRVRRGEPVEVATFRVGERDNALASFAGTMRRAGAGPDAIYAAMKAMLDNGQIEQGAERKDKITERDLRRIAGSIGTRQSETVDSQRTVKRKKPERHFAQELLDKDLRPLEYLVEDILPEGFGIIAGSPKVGKSWLTFLAAIEIATGGELLGHPVDEARPVLYYGLEDGERRFKERLETLIGARSLDLGLLELRYEAPLLGSGLEEDVAEWLDDNPQGITFVDVLAKVRPMGKGKTDAYNEDYSILTPLQTVSKDRPGSAIAMVTHDRKVTSENLLSDVTGSRGVTGSSDWVWVVKRKNNVDDGFVYVTGRDIRRDHSIKTLFTGSIWRSSGPGAVGGNAEQRKVADALRTEGNMTVWEVVAYLYPLEPKSHSRQVSVTRWLNDLAERGWVTPGAYVAGHGRSWHILTEDERAEQVARRRAASVAVAATHPGIPVRQVHSLARDRARESDE